MSGIVKVTVDYVKNIKLKATITHFSNLHKES
jgi:hypothetical protein